MVIVAMEIRRVATVEFAIIIPRMANTLTSLHYHVVFSTKDREAWISPEIEQRVWSFLGGIANENGMKLYQIGGMPDHIHMLISLPTSLAVSKALQQIKGGSSKWIKTEFERLAGFAWQDGYGAFTVSKSNVPEVAEYIRGQKEHHRTKTFQEEYVAFLKRHEIQYDDRYLWT